jgi:cellulose synthase/poly-beta-1,6-N-acetylglucosamine synthase-like glycosyltransferase
MVPEALFWLSFLALGYVYLGYAAIMRLLASLFGRPVRVGSVTPSVTIVVTAFNEERGIQEKLRNLLSLRYPASLFDVVVASDGSTDRTDEIVRGEGNSRVRLLRVEGRVGKTQCQNQAVEACTSDIVVFTDATTVIDAGALEQLVRNFSDPEVGCVAAQLVYLGKGANATAAGGTAYWGYEMALRAAESSLGSLIGVSGCLYAVRREAYREIRADLISDFVIAMRMRERGLRTVLEPKALCYEETLDRSAQELSMRVRVAIRSIAALVSERHMLNPARYGLFSIALLSHKALRYLSPLLWIVAVLSCLPLAGSPLYLAFLLGNALLFGAGIVGLCLHSRGAKLGPVGKAYYFLLTNLASLLAIFRYLKGERVRTWSPVR